jgi:hypothetical protein
MAQVIVDVPDAVLPRVLDAFAATFGYQATLPSGAPNPQTRAQFAKQRLAAYVKQVTVAYEATRDAEAARQTSTQTANTDIAVT